MVKFILQIFSVFLIGVGATALAQDREPPLSREQVMLSFAPLVKKVSPAVVNIYAKRVVTRSYSPFMGDPLFERFFGEGFGGLDRQQVESSLGSGVIIEPEGVVVTNAHVIKGAQEISIGLSDGREFDAKIALIDEPSDLAVLHIDADGEKLPYATLNPSEALEVGDIVLAIGNPFGVGQTVTSGIVSALARSSLNISDYNFFIQTDAAINPGNSGGPLVSMDGGVVGINTAIYSQGGGSLGIGFAIPSEMVATVVTAAKEGVVAGRGITRPWIGVSAQPVTADIANSLELNRPVGILVTRLHAASPAKAAGLQIGDVIIAINGKTVRDTSEMKFRLATVPIGQEAALDVLRRGKEKTIRFKATAPPDTPPRQETVLEGSSPLSGVKVSNLNPAVAAELGLDPESEGVVILGAGKGGQGLRFVGPGDIVLSVNGIDVADVSDLEAVLARRPASWALVFERGGQKRQIIIR